MTTYGVTDSGFVLKPLDVIRDEMAAKQRADIDPNWNTESDSVAGQYNGIVADQLAQLWEVSEANSNALSRDADGAPLDIIGALTGTPRRAATTSKVTLTVTLGSGITVPAGSIVSVENDPSIRVVTLADVTAPATTVAAQAETAGAVTANSGTLSVIETPVSGWSAVTNADPLAGGLPIETDEQYRLRQLDELARGGGGSVPGIRADILAIGDEVTACEVLENDTLVTVDGMPGKSVEAIVQGGDDQDIADALFASKSGGIYTHGSVGPITVVDDQGYEHDVRFSRPTGRRVYIALGLTTVGDYTDLETEVKDAIVAAAVTRSSHGYQAIGGDVYAAQILVAALSVANVLNGRAALSFSTISDPTAGASALTISSREIATIASIDIVVSAL